MKGKQNGKDSSNFVMVTNNTKSKLRKDRPMPIWVPMNNMSITLNALHRSGDTMFGRKIEKESAQDHVIVVSGVEKEYAIRKVAMMDSRGSGEGQVATTTGEG